MNAGAASYSGTPLARKLGIKPGACVALVRAPADFDRALGELPDGVRVRTRARTLVRTPRAPWRPAGEST